ncbi:MAG TPA: crotonase/enoyl-CoA hydratase family protein [Acidisoma sp.]|jgi:DSF synthase|uniref:crotonase/enoyl-CoA hydratase family protein n=1 Tax=Acidisoma sp. TaxID=1872115 RepID=UPI002B952075|nr:crotonase/enoyl-CoA hydratase family protein [Acidisoma sp.]HTH99868.1 crotonase/enoyl-CoA hydratase family protein [Acidisoma sp.]
MTFVHPSFGVVTSPTEMSTSVATLALSSLTQNYYPTMQVELDQPAKALFCFMRPDGRPSYTPELLRDMSRIQKDIALATAGAEPFRYVVVGSRVLGTFNLGGDLDLFGAKIRAGARDALRAYAHACVDIVYHNAVGYDRQVTTVALVQGAALGGGFEAALSCHHIVAERSATFGLPEVLFNLFPGMGAYSLLSRRLDPARAEKLILSGKIFSAVELHEMGLVDHLAEDGEGDTAVREYLGRLDRRFNAHQAVLKARHRVNPLTREELIDVVDVWVDAAMKLEEADLRKMARLVRAQSRRHGSGADQRLAAE